MTHTRPSRLVLAALLSSALSVGAAPMATGATSVPGSVTAVGANASGQLGDGTTKPRTVPGAVPVESPVAVASGRDTAYALDVHGRVWAWGENAKGSVGDGTVVDRLTPVRLPLTGVVEVEAGHYHGIALTADGQVWTWGFGRLGQIGDGGTTNRRSPVRVVDLADKGIVHVAAGRDASYATGADGRVWAWGSNTLGELADGSSVGRLRPALVPGIGGVVELGVGRNHVLARTASGEVWAWGDDRYGQVGDGSADGGTAQRTPVRITVAPVTHVDAGAHHSLVVTTSGTVLSWGRGYRGQLGSGSTAARTSPGSVGGLPTNVVDVGDGRDQSFAITSSGEVWAWGSNAAGQLGDGSTVDRTRPVKTLVSGAKVAQGGSAHTVFFSG